MDKDKMVESVVQAQGNDVNAFASLFLDYKDAAYYVAKKMFSDENKALNIVYETCILVFRQIKTLNPASAFALWVNMIAGSVCKRRLAKEEQDRLAPGEKDVALMGVNEDANAQISREAFDNAETRSMICAIVDVLPADQKLCALLYYFCGLKVEYIAQALGSTPLAIKNRLFSATNKIKEGMYGFENRGEKLYAVPAWLIASSLIMQAKTMQMNPTATQQVFAAGAQLVSGKAIVPQVLVDYAQAQQAEPAQPAQPAQPVYESVAVEPQPKATERESVRPEDVAEMFRADTGADEQKKPAKKKKKGGVIALIVLLVILLLAAAVFVLPRVTDGRIDPLNTVLALFSSPEDRLAKADEQMAAGNYADAASILEKLVEKDATNADYYLRLVNVYEQLGQADNAAGAYRNYFALVPRQDNLELLQRYIAAAPNDPIVWADETFGGMIAAALGKESVTPADLQSVSELYLLGSTKAYTDAQSYADDMAANVLYSTDANERNTAYIYNGAENGAAYYDTFIDLLYFPNLRTLHLDFVGYSDLDTVLRLKTDLTALHFSGCQLGSVPDLTMLGSLNALTISHDTLTDISPLSNLYGLTRLDLSHNEIANVTPLSTLTGLTSLNLFSNTIEDVTPLGSLTALTELDLGRNRIEDFDPLDDLEFDSENYNDDDQFWEPEEVVE